MRRGLTLSGSVLAAAFVLSCGGGDSPVNASSAGTGTGDTTGSMIGFSSSSGSDSATRGTAGSGDAADSTGNPTCTIETAAEDCDDSDPCTQDQCNASAECFSEPWPSGTPCEADDGTPGSCQDDGCVVECTSDETCDDDNACTIDSCDTRLGACVNDPLDGIDAPVDAQTPGDCSIVACVGGNEVPQADDSDLADDRNECTVDSCSRGTPDSTPAVVGFPCGADGLCDGDGSCVECNSPSDCTDLPIDDDCRTRTCTAGVCGQDFVDQVTEVNATRQTLGNCQLIVCDGAGDIESETDNSDVPFDGLECTQDLCTAGAPSNPPAASGEDCGGIGVCDGFGICVGCVNASDCGGSDTFCQTITCANNTCGVNNAPVGLPLPLFDQTANDCQQLVCDGGGSQIALADDADLPNSDGNDCTGESCNNGMTLFPDLDLDDPCDQDGGVVCDGDGSCVECNEAAQCSGAGQCGANACNDNVCGVDPVGLGTPCSDGLFCTQADECNGAGTCIGGGTPCPGPDGDSNCAESCNEGTNSCDAVDPALSACEDGLFCTNNDTCDGSGTCQAGGATCAGADGDSDCTESCDEGANNCNAVDPPGTTCNDGLFCTQTDQCNAAGVCEGGGDPCPGPDDGDDCSERCSEFFNTCTANDPNGSACNDGLFCTQTDTCSGGSCNGSGNPCTGADGDGNCAESCDEGTNNCGGNDPAGSACDDGQFCTDNDTCNASGACTGSGDPCDGPDGDGDCTETCDESDNDCGGQDPNGAVCDPGGIFGGLCANGLCVGI
ncbi:MAG: hypothetical protein JKY37_24165 [Nannocystaceae bacterium]|nr:hypothetical protein [Nannocystaceae bacterium]